MHESCNHNYIFFPISDGSKNKKYTRYCERKETGKTYLRLTCHCDKSVSGCNHCYIKICEKCLHVTQESEFRSCEGISY